MVFNTTNNILICAALRRVQLDRVNWTTLTQLQFISVHLCWSVHAFRNDV